MNLRITFFAIGALFFSRIGGLAQVDAQDRTQRFFDNNKGADVINPNRALTDRIRQPHELTHKSTLPALTGVPDAKPVSKRRVSTKELRNLREERDVFIEIQVKQAEKAKARSQNVQMLAEATPVNVNQVRQSAKQAWEHTENGKKLRQLESRGARESFLPPLSK